MTDKVHPLSITFFSLPDVIWLQKSINHPAWSGLIKDKCNFISISSTLTPLSSWTFPCPVYKLLNFRAMKSFENQLKASLTVVKIWSCWVEHLIEEYYYLEEDSTRH